MRKNILYLRTFLATLILVGCNARIAVPPGACTGAACGIINARLVLSSDISSAYSSGVISPAPQFSMVDGSGNPLTLATERFSLSAHSDSECTSSFNGTLLGTDVYEVNANTVSFPQLSYTLPDALEATIYIKVRGKTSQVSVCSPVYVIHKFAAGTGYARWNPGAAGAAGGGYDIPYRAVRDASGRTLICGFSGDTSNRDYFTLWRFNPNGTPDTTFGTNGAAVLLNGHVPLGGSNAAGRGDFCEALAIDDTGRIIMVGEGHTTSGAYVAIFAAFAPDGTLDTSFASTGYTVFQPGGTGAAGASNASKNDFVKGVVVDSDGAFLAVGHSTNASGRLELTFWRYLPDGSLDSHFGTNGVLVLNHNAAGFAGALSGSKNEYASVLVRDAEGRFLITGSSTNAAGGKEIAVWRILSNGSLDTSFGNGAGVALYSNGSTGFTSVTAGARDESGTNLMIDSDGSIVVSAAVKNAANGKETAIVRFTKNGAIDTGFGASAGYTRVRPDLTGAAGGSGASKNDGGFAIAKDPKGRYVVAGLSANAAGGVENAIWRFLGDGTVDSSFGTSGVALFRHNGLGAANISNTNKFDGLIAIWIDAIGRYTVSGYAGDKTGSPWEAAIYRFLPNGQLDL